MDTIRDAYEQAQQDTEAAIWEIWDNLPPEDRIAIDKKVSRVIEETRSRYTCRIYFSRETILLAYIQALYYAKFRESVVQTRMRTLGWGRSTV